MAFHIITDSASDIPVSVRKEYGVHVIPTPVTIDGTDYFDGETIFPEEFYRIQKEGHDIKTYHVSQQMFYDHFKPFAEAGDSVLYICFSTGIAGTFNAASLAKEDLLEEFPDFDLTIIDSKCASLGFGLVVYKLLQMQKNGAPQDLIIEAAQFYCAHMVHAVTVPTLTYLFKGGRLSATSMVAGSMLDIKPIIMVDKDGALKSVEKVRGWKKALKRVVEIVSEKGVDLDKQVVGVVRGNDMDSYQRIVELLQENCHVKGILDTQVGCAIGAHTGPGISAVVFLNETNEKYDRYLD